MGVFPDWMKNPIESIAEMAARYMVGGVKGFWREFTKSVFDLSIPETSGPFVFGEPQCQRGICELATVYDMTWFGWVTGLSLTLLFLTKYVQKAGIIFGITSSVDEKRHNRQAFRAAVLILAWFPLALGLWAVSNWLALHLLPDPKALSKGMLSLLSSTAISALVSAPVTGVVILIAGAAAVLLSLLFEARPVLFLLYLAFGQLLIVARYSGLPVLQNIGRRLLYQYVPVCLMPIPAAALGRLYTEVFFKSTAGGVIQATSGLYLMTLFLILALILSWKMFSYAAPMVSSAVSTATKAGVGMAVGYGIMSAGGSAFTAAQAVRGRPAAAATMASARNPDAVRGAAESASQAVSDKWGEIRRTENHVESDPLDPWGHNSGGR